MERVLIVEDSRMFSSVIKRQVEKQTGFEARVAEDYAEAKALLEAEADSFFISLLDLNLPDAPRGEVVDLVLSYQVPVVVVTGDLGDEARDRIWSKKVVDYVLKEGSHSVDYLATLVGRIYRNRNIKVMVVDDSKLSRKIVSDLLKVHQYEVYEAADGQQALDILDQNKDIKIVVTDFNMPVMDGFELTKNIRSKYGRDEMSIVGISGQAGHVMSAKFIKYGANDFIIKPFANEEFYCRITQCIEMIEYVGRVKELSNTDPLTTLYNRRFFFDSGDKMHASAKRDHINVAVAMLDIDFFKKINDNYGHDAGDEVLKRMAKILKSRFRNTDIVSRFGGEEFCILMVNMDKEKVREILDNLRVSFENSETVVGEQTIHYTVSIGVCTALLDSLEEMIKQADLNLYEAKESGRNKVVLDC